MFFETVYFSHLLQHEIRTFCSFVRLFIYDTYADESACKSRDGWCVQCLEGSRIAEERWTSEDGATVGSAFHRSRQTEHGSFFHDTAADWWPFRTELCGPDDCRNATDMSFWVVGRSAVTVVVLLADLTAK